MCISRQIVQNMFRTSEGWFDVDHPVFVEEESQKRVESAGLSKALERAVELELVLLEELLKSGCELAAEDAAECTDGQEESVGRSDPSGAIGSKAASGNDVMYVGMMLKVLTPGMKHAKKPDICSQVLRVSSKFEERRCTSSEQQIVK